MSADRDPAPTAAQLLAAYAADPSALTAGERAAVEDLIGRDPAAASELARLREAIAATRAAAPATGEPDWDRLAADIGRALDAQPGHLPRRRRRVALGAGAVVAAAAALLVWWRLPGSPAPVPVVATTIDAGAPAAPPELPRPPAADEVARGDAELDVLAAPEDLGGGAIDDRVLDALVDEEPGVALDDVAAPSDDRLLPDSGWIDELSDAELDLALEWLEANAPTRKAG
ncbi:MAG TPA: hypothetical protein VM734_21945 [Kofleriaceae bacterium]|nr:hypothetical protein [Kofleriaceae bacterium]